MTNLKVEECTCPLCVEITQLREVNEALVKALKTASITLQSSQGEWVSITSLHAPLWTHPLKYAVLQIDAALVLAGGEK